ncbi:MAG: hypothetical protein K8I03_08155 [Ignavibacteria bacterium]|nr:hypothetical protein [Ignavibacteria bacterium]
MALRRRNPSAKVTKAEKRLEAMKKIDLRNNRQINYGGDNNPLTSVEMLKQIEECRQLIIEYNSMIEMVDERSAAIRKAEEKLGDYFTRVLAGGRSIFGVDSDEVEELGGTKKSERKKPIKYNKISFNNLNNITS